MAKKENIKVLDKGIESIIKQIEQTPESKKKIEPLIKIEHREALLDEEQKNQLGITADKDDFSQWFTELMIKAELADYTEVSGCMVFRPYSYAICEKIVQEVDKRFKKLGVKNAYFPLFIPEKLLNKEKEHVEGFSPEVAWVTQSGDTPMTERLAVRPTSETIMYPSYAKWIRSHRDLPLKINQWNNVVRWEFKHPVPFFRTREFLWNELHTVCATEKESIEEGKQIISAYNEVTEDLMALHGIYGRKTENEKFAGAVFSEKVHYIMGNGKVLEGCPFHHDGQNFAKAYDIEFLNKDGKKEYGWQNTYAISTRMLGIMFAIHADSKGLILPPKMAPNPIVIVPILFEDTKNKVLNEANKILKALEIHNPLLDAREEYKAGFKFNEWELKGIPLRIEIGPKDIETEEVIVYRRDTGTKEKIKIKELSNKIPAILEDIQKKLFDKSKKVLEEKIERAETLEILKKVIENKKVGISPMCKNERCEEILKAETKGAKALFIDEHNKIKPNEKCIICKNKAEYNLYLGKTY
jgi:prolyl-tRNA synthetase